MNKKIIQVNDNLEKDKEKNKYISFFYPYKNANNAKVRFFAQKLTRMINKKEDFKSEIHFEFFSEINEHIKLTANGDESSFHYVADLTRLMKNLFSEFPEKYDAATSSTFDSFALTVELAISEVRESIGESLGKKQIENLKELYIIFSHSIPAKQRESGMAQKTENYIDNIFHVDQPTYPRQVQRLEQTTPSKKTSSEKKEKTELEIDSVENTFKAYNYDIDVLRSEIRKLTASLNKDKNLDKATKNSQLQKLFAKLNIMYMSKHEDETLRDYEWFTPDIDVLTDYFNSN